MWIHCCHCTLQAKLCVFVMYEQIEIIFLPLQTMKHNKKENSGTFHWVAESEQS